MQKHSIDLTFKTDLDLLSLYSIPEFDFKQWAKESLLTYIATGEILRSPLPKAPESLTVQKTTFDLTFDEQSDAIIDKWLDSLHPFQQSGAVKTLLRASLAGPCEFAYYEDYPLTVLKAKRKKKSKSRNEG